MEIDARLLRMLASDPKKYKSQAIKIPENFNGNIIDLIYNGEELQLEESDDNV